MAEDLARDRLKELFNAEYANVQPHSGSQANMGVFNVFLNHMDTVMGLDLAHGGHLTHGSKVNFSGNMYNFISYSVLEDTGRVDFDEVWKKAKEHKIVTYTKLKFTDIFPEAIGRCFDLSTIISYFLSNISFTIQPADLIRTEPKKK